MIKKREMENDNFLTVSGCYTKLEPAIHLRVKILLSLFLSFRNLKVNYQVNSIYTSTFERQKNNLLCS